MSFGGVYFTNRGLALQAKAETGVELHFTRLAVGDGDLGGQAIPALTALIHEVKSLAITKLNTLPGGKAVVGGVLSNQDIVAGFYWKELGLFATDPDLGEILYCYGNAGALAEYIPSPGGAEILEKLVNIVAVIGNAANVSATIEQSLVYATQQELIDHINDAAGAHAASAISVADAGGHLTATDVEGALAELFQFASDGKTGIAAAIGAPATAGDTFAQLAAKITGPKADMAAAITNAGGTAAGTDPLADFAAKITAVAGGVKIKSIQYGTYTCSAFNNSSQTVILATAVVPENCIVLINTDASRDGDAAGRGTVTADVTAATTLTFTGVNYQGSVNPQKISYVVLEFDPASIKSIQKGYQIEADTVVISSVDTTKAILFSNAILMYASTSSDTIIYAELTNATTVTVSTINPKAGSCTAIQWFVVELK